MKSDFLVTSLYYCQQCFLVCSELRDVYGKYGGISHKTTLVILFTSMQINRNNHELCIHWHVLAIISPEELLPGIIVKCLLV